jgi:adenylyltransferase/sulfurtransferase
MNSGVPEIDALELKARIDAEHVPVLVDVREAFERAIADLPDVGQRHIPLSELAGRMHELPRDDEIVVYCRSGSRSASVVQFLRAQGFERVLNLRGGVLGWQEDVDPSLTRY